MEVYAKVHRETQGTLEISSGMLAFDDIALHTGSCNQSVAVIGRCGCLLLASLNGKACVFEMRLFMLIGGEVWM